MLSRKPSRYHLDLRMCTSKISADEKVQYGLSSERSALRMFADSTCTEITLEIMRDIRPQIFEKENGASEPLIRESVLAGALQSFRR